MANRILRVLAAGLLVGGCLLSRTSIETTEIPIETDETPIEIVETVKVYPERHPDAVHLIENEIHETKGWDEGCEDNTIQLSYEDAQILLKIAAAEAGGEDVEGQLYVMETIWNRVMLEDGFYYFPNSIKEVVFQKSAFSSVTEGKFDTAEPNYRTHLALARFESNLNLDKEVLGFETTKNGRVLLKWFDYYKTHGGHDLYKAKKKD